MVKTNPFVLPPHLTAPRLVSFTKPFRHVVPALLLAGLTACSPETLRKSNLDLGASTEDTSDTLLDEVGSGYVSWDGQGRLDISPPAEVLEEIRSRCKEMGFDLGYITSISLELTMIKAEFDCRGAS